MESSHSNWIEGAPRPAVGGATYALAGPAGERLGSWPRSGPDDLRDALRALGRGAQRWVARGATERRARLAALARHLVESPDPTGLVARSLGFDPAVGPPADDDLERTLAPLREPAHGGSAPAPVLVAAHWSELQVGIARRSVAALAAGRGVGLLSDPSCPALAQAVLDAALAAGIEPGALALLHDDTRAVLRAALATSGLCVDASGPGRSPAGVSEEGPAAGAAGFGAGVHGRGAVLHWTPLRPVAAVLPPGVDPPEAARRLARAAFGRREALAGQLARAVRRVVCPPRLLSALTRGLLEALEGEDADLLPLPFVESGTAQALEQVRDQGLDEGATLLHAPRDSHRPGREGRLVRLVFTNVEAHMRLAAPVRPLPVLLLSRGPGPFGGVDTGGREPGRR